MLILLNKRLQFVKYRVTKFLQDHLNRSNIPYIYEILQRQKVYLIHKNVITSENWFEALKARYKKK